MKLIVGYQLRPNRRLIEKIIEHRSCVSEVYFAWPGIANGRSTIAQKLDLPPWLALNKQLEELKELSETGMSLNLLLNGNCYGAASLSRSFYSQIGDLIDQLSAEISLNSITTSSPVIAKFVKQNFPELEVRASVNMEIGTPEGIEYLSDIMDGFYVKREMNRHIAEVSKFAEVCHKIGKKVFLLANSGCLNHCSVRNFHDNLVSHEIEIMRIDNAYSFRGVCREFLNTPEMRRRILQLSNWICPNDLWRYENLVDGIKLATRVSENPEMIVEAYASGHFSGNLLSLMEPDFSAMYRPFALSASHMPRDFFERTSSCTRNCAECGFCLQAFDNAAENFV